MRRSGSLIALAGFATGTLVAAWFGSRYSPSSGENRIWYKSLRKPAYNPPKVVFPIVWPVLYTLMAFSGWRVWRGKILRSVAGRWRYGRRNSRQMQLGQSYFSASIGLTWR